MRKYKTKQRDTVLAVFHDHPSKCFSVKELSDMCPTVGVTTVYRTLALLEEEGNIRRYIGTDGDLFKLSSPDDGHHMHIVCRSCGNMLHSECKFIGEMEDHLKTEHDFSLDTASTVIYGFCGKCRRGDVS